MSSFEKIIGYAPIKQELMQICDMLRNREIYEALGASIPKGILLYGKPGVGKTLLATCLMEESGLPSYTLRKSRGSSKLVAEIAEIFQEAKRTAPSIVLLDDLDKFANEGEPHKNAEEYVAVQAAIDDVRDTEMLVLATANDTHKLPDSLLRSRRFDRTIAVEFPSEADVEAILRHFLSTKKVSDDFSILDLSKMLCFSSCAELETILNEAAIRAAYARKSSIGMEDMVHAVLRLIYKFREEELRSEAQLQEVALHEAGHLVVSEVLCPGCIGLASLRHAGTGTNGFVRYCQELETRDQKILAALAGKAAVELSDCSSAAPGCKSDIFSALVHIRNAMAEQGTRGFGMVDVGTSRFPDTSESLNARMEAVTQAELERYLMQAKNILLRNREFLEKATAMLQKKVTLLYSDIQELKKNVPITDIF